MSDLAFRQEPEALAPSTGWNVLHLFCKATPAAKASAVLEAIDATRKHDHQVVTASMIGHKADMCVFGLGADLHVLRRLQTAICASGLEIADSYVSLTETSEYATGMPEHLKKERLYPTLPPDGMRAFCFYPMSKRRAPGAENWYRLDYDERLRLMYAHGSLGRTFRGRVLQLITGSTGTDDFEWGVSLFAVAPDDLKECIYKMRYDEASAVYAEFGTFYLGMVGEDADVLAEIGVC
ncbi:MAG: chlorite dismutase family protein [Acidimicrobiales bacterium]